MFELFLFLFSSLSNTIKQLKIKKELWQDFLKVLDFYHRASLCLGKLPCAVCSL